MCKLPKDGKRRQLNLTHCGLLCFALLMIHLVQRKAILSRVEKNMKDCSPFYNACHHIRSLFSVLPCTVLYYTVLYCTILYYTILYRTVLYCTVMCCEF